MLYDFPKYYDVLFSFRDISAEAGFMRQCIERYSTGPVESALEIACGSAPHAGALIVHGMDYTGLDINRMMLSQGREVWSRLTPRPRLVEADMVRFDLARHFDFAFVMLGSLYLSSSAQMATHFDSMARHLRPGALYFMDMCIDFTDPVSHQGQPPVRQARRQIEVCSEFEIRLVDPVDHVYEERWTIDIDDHGDEFSLQMTEINKAIWPDEFRSFIDARSDFEFVGWWRDWDLDQPLGNAPPDDASDLLRPLTIIRRCPD